MSGPVDVLAVLDAEIKDIAGLSCNHDDGEALLRAKEKSLRAARTAVAELIEADREYDAALTELSDLNRRIAEHGWIEVEHDALRKAGRRLVHAQSRRHAALANVGSAS
jgi:hypothetical protein